MINRLRAIAAAILIVVSILSAGLLAYRLWENHDLQKRFKKTEHAYPYGEAAEKNELDLDIISLCFPDAEAAIKYHFQNEIRIPSAISYYADMKGGAPICTIEKGETVFFKTEHKTSYGFSYRGNESLPTIRAGWRLARPFSPEGEEGSDTLLYVKLNDLMSVADQWLKENPNAEKILQNVLIRQGLLPTRYSQCRYVLLFADRALYSAGIFLSPDLKQPVLFPAACLTISLLLLAGVLLVKRRNR